MVVALGLVAKMGTGRCVGVKLTEYNITPINRSTKNNTAGGEGTIESPVAALPRSALVSFQDSPFVK